MTINNETISDLKDLVMGLQYNAEYNYILDSVDKEDLMGALDTIYNLLSKCE